MIPEPDEAEMAFLEQYGFARASPMTMAIRQGDYTKVETLLKRRSNNNDMKKWVNEAARKDVGMVELFLDHGAKVMDIAPSNGEIEAMILFRYRCKRSAQIVYQVLRKRYRVPSLAFPNGGYRLPKEISNQIAKNVWELRSKR